MRSLHVIFFVVLCVVIDKAMGESKSVKAYRYKTKIHPQTPPFMSTAVPLQNGQPITYFKDFGTETLYFNGKVTYDRNGHESTAALLREDENLDVCEEIDDGSWSDVVGQLIRKSWLPEASCPVKAGNYSVVEPTGPIKMDIREHLYTSTYYIEVNVGHSKTQKIFTTTYLFEILR